MIWHSIRSTALLFLPGVGSFWLWGWAQWELKLLIHSATDQRYLFFLDGSRNGEDLFATPFDFTATVLVAVAIAIPVSYFARRGGWIFWVGLLVGLLLWVVLVLPDVGTEFLLYFLSRAIFPTYIVSNILGFWFGSYLRKRMQAQQSTPADAPNDGAPLS